MLFNYNEINNFINPKTVKGCIHIGAHLLEENDFYKNELGLTDENIIWIEANPEVFLKAKSLFPNSIIVNALLTDTIGETDFMITNNGQSSSVLNLNTHLIRHPEVYTTKYLKLPTNTLDSLFQNFSGECFNMLNIDVQGAELLVLKGGKNLLSKMKYIYIEVNREELYRDCCLVWQLDEWLKDFGFTRVFTKWTQYNWADALYVKLPIETNSF